MSHRINLPSMLQIGENASEFLPDLLKSFNCKNPLLVTDKTMVQLDYAAHIVNILSKDNIPCAVFADTIPEPTWESIQAGIEAAKTGQHDSIVALGGGSPIDSAKAIAILCQFGGTMRDYSVPNIVGQHGLPVIAIPTTAGTGSEVTKVTIITDEANDEKLLCMGAGFMPKASIIDPVLTLSVPPRTTADTGIDALTHAIEAYVSKKANPFSDVQALAAMKMIAPNLRTVFHDGKNIKARTDMMIGSMLAGVAFSNASVALVHGMSRPIGALYHVPHGLSNAMLLPAVTEFSLSHAKERYAECARAMQIASPTDSDSVANEKLLAELRALNAELDVPTPQKYGITKDKYFDSFETMASQAIASGSPANNPRVPTKDEIMQIYAQIW